MDEADVPGPAGEAAHRTLVVVDVEGFGDHRRTNPDRLAVRAALYRVMRAAFSGCGVEWATCRHVDRGDGVLVFVPPEVTKSIFAQRLPDRLAALLAEHNGAHPPLERIRLRLALHAGEVYRDAHGAVGRAVNHVCRLVDSAPVREALAGTAGPLALIASDWFFEEVVRHGPGGGAGAYRPVRVVAKETDAVAWVRRGGPPQAPGAPRAADEVLSALWKTSDDSARRFGARRTACPLDLSIAELHDRGLCVPPVCADDGLGREGPLVDAVVAEVAADRSVLVLGEPGSGKSVAAYAVLRVLRSSVPAVAVRGGELRELIDDPGRFPALHEAAERGPTRPVLLVDGLDEVPAGPVDPAGLLRRAGERFTLVATCRQREFEDHLAPAAADGAFDAVRTVGAWTLDGRFTEFVRRLVAGGLLASDDLVEAVRRSPGLARMVVRPLHARLVTSLGRTGLGPVTTTSALCAEHVDKLAAVSDVALARAGCHGPRSSLDLWVEAAWAVFRCGRPSGDRFDFDAVVARVGDGGRCAARALSQVCDRRRSAGRVWGSFAHRAFFGYLVGRYYLDRLDRASAGGGVAELVDCLRVEPTPGIRDFLVDRLRPARAAGPGAALEAAYRHARAAGPGTALARTTGDLVAHLLSRAVAGGREALRRLLDGEDDAFLRQALLRELCHLGDPEALREFVEHARESEQWRAWNRDRLLRDHGDPDHHEEPPHADPDRRRGRERLIALVSEPDYAERVAPQRRYLDLFTLYDCARWRGEAPAGPERAALAAAERALRADPAIDPALLRELAELRSAVASVPRREGADRGARGRGGPGARPDDRGPGFANLPYRTDLARGVAGLVRCAGEDRGDRSADERHEQALVE
ncbi:hypothetical protein [Saccharothrix algeriensis]|uniref:AAA+ ATPase domain-containing protein n=2 Tax=Saccharothrix algeriensis TaxID=173560 RepID=A0ABS2SDB8_9PSEU|nr:hypothetical protein [Saccharothrix algeriensis]MBM7814252.1 hypothetical protein [Saccharothrix algeriensis]